MKNDELNLDKFNASKALHQEINNRTLGVRRIQQLIEQGADINYQAEEDGYTALMLAVDTDHQRITEYLLSLCANPLLRNHHYEIASDLALQYSPVYLALKNYELLFATLNNDLENVKAIIDAGAIVNFQVPDGYTALLIAVDQSLVEMTELLLSKGADITFTRADGQGVFELVTDEQVLLLLESESQGINHNKHGLSSEAINHVVDDNFWDSIDLTPPTKPKNIESKKPLNFFFGFNNNKKIKFDSYTQNEEKLPTFDIRKLKIKSHERDAFEQTVSSEKLFDLEKKFGHALPESYKEILRKYNGGIPELKYSGPDKKICNFSCFLSISDTTQSSDVNISQVRDRVPMFSEPGMLPFALDSVNGIYIFVWEVTVAQVWILRCDEFGEPKLDKYGDPDAEFVANFFDQFLEYLCEYHEKYEQKLMAGETFDQAVEPFDLNTLKISPQNWSGFEPTATNAQIDELEKSVGNALPENYKEILRKYNGGDPEFNRFDVDEETYSLNYFYSLGDRKDSSLNIWWALNEFSTYAGPDTLPFAVDGTSETYFFKWVDGIAQVWILRCHDLEEPEADFVTYSFDDLLRALY